MSASKKLGELRRKQWRDKIELTDDEHRLCADYELEIECESYLDLPDIWKEQHLGKHENLKDYEFDHAPKNNQFYDLQITSFWTPHGINGIESWFCKKIRNREIDNEKLIQMIKRNPHISNVSKTNLLSNIHI